MELPMYIATDLRANAGLVDLGLSGMHALIIRQACILAVITLCSQPKDAVSDGAPSCERTVTGLFTGCTFDSSTRISITYTTKS
jgi:hypothetical protein